MAIEPTNFDDGEEDIKPSPAPGPAGQDRIQDKGPDDAYGGDPPEQGELVGPEALKAVEEISEQLAHLDPSSPEDNEALDAGSTPTPQADPVDSGSDLPTIEVQNAVDLPKGGDPISGGDTELPSETIETTGAAPGVEELDEAGKALEAFGNDVEAFHNNSLPQIDMGGGGGGGDAGGESNIPEALDADYKHKETSTDSLIEYIRKVNELTARLERERI